MPSLRLPTRLAALAALLVALALPSAAHALVIPMGVDELAAAADAVVVATVLDVDTRSAGGDPERPVIVTDYRLQVTRTLKGTRPVSFTLTLPGGTLGDLALVVSDTPTFAAGEECALFLKAGEVVGGEQGKLTVRDGRVPALGVTLDGLARRVSAADGGFVRGGVAAALSALEGSFEPVGEDISIQAVPAISSVTPANANAGVGETVTVMGSGFGSTQGTGRVEFNRGDSQDPAVVVTAPVVSWTDTQIVVTVPALAEKWVRVVNASGTSPNFSYDCGFSTNGRRWWAEDLPVTYRINENTSDMTGEGAQIQAAMTTWNAAGSTFRFAYGGTTTRTVVNGAQDGLNEIFFITDSGGGYVGRNYAWYTPSTTPWRLLESDIVFNDAYAWAPTAGSSVIDLQTVAAHELGHTLGLDDQYEELSDIMGAAQYGVNKRVLTVDEIAGAIYLYGGSSTPPAAPTVTSSSHPSQDAWSASSSAMFSFSSSGAAGYSYVLDGSPSTTPDTTSEGAGGSASYLSLTQGDRYFHVRAQGAGGSWGTATHYRIRVDTVAPTGTAQIGPAGVQYLASPTVAISSSVSDGAGSGVTQMRTTTNGGSTWSGWTSYAGSTSVTLPAQGSYTVGIQVRDAAGNAFTSQRALVYDLTPPVTTSNAQPQYRVSASITLTPGDAVSGVTATYWGLDSAPGTLWTGAPITTDVVGDHTLYWYSTDAADNVEAEQSASFTVSADAAAEVSRLAGPNRWDTAIAIASATFPGWTGVTDVVVACGEDRAMADPLSAAGLAGCYDAPILLVPSVLRSGALPAGIESAIKGMRDANGGRVNVHVIGGSAVVPAAVYARLDTLNGSGSIRRIAGPDRYRTSVQVASAIVGAVGAGNVPGVLVANGADSRAFSDALAVAPASASEHRPLLLVRPTGVSGEVAGVLATTFAGKPRLVVNGSAYVAENVRSAVGASERMTTSADRVTAAVQIAEYAMDAGWLDADRVCVANTLCDSLSGGAAMGYLRTPIVYTNATSLPAATSGFLDACTPQVGEVFALGGPVVISDGVLDTVRSILE